MKIAVVFEKKDNTTTSFIKRLYGLCKKHYSDVNIKPVQLYRGDKDIITKTTCKKYIPAVVEELSSFKPKFIFTIGHICTTLLLGSNDYTSIIHKLVMSQTLKTPVIALFDAITYEETPDILQSLEDYLKKVFETKTLSISLITENIFDEYKIIEILEEACTKNLVAIDVETTGLNIYSDNTKILSFGIAFDKKGYAFPLDLTLKEVPLINTSHILPLLTKLLCNKKRTILGHNIKFDINAIRSLLGIECQARLLDTMVMHYITDENSSHSLESLLNIFNIENHKTINFHETKYESGNFESMDEINEFLTYNGKDALALLYLIPKLAVRLDKDDKSVLTMLMTLIQTLAEIEFTGFPINIETLQNLKPEVEKDLLETEERLRNYPEVKAVVKKKHLDELNFNAPQQIAEVFKQGNYPIISKTPTGLIATNAKVLNILAEIHDIEFARDLVKFKTYSKIYNSYIVPYLSGEHVVNKRIHPTFNPATVVTGRLSCKEPNLQQIPKKSDFKNIFVPLPEHDILLTMDYSQAELRVMAGLSQDTGLMTAYKQNIDIHLLTAANILNKDISDITDDERYIAKTINFSLIYGSSAEAISNKFNRDIDEVKFFIDQWYRLYPGVMKYRNKVIYTATQHKEIKTPFGRKRRLIFINSKNKYKASEAQRQAFNFMIQSTAADFTALTLNKVYKYIKTTGIKAAIVNTVHDSIMVSTTFDSVKELAYQIKDIAENHPTPWMHGVPMVAEFELGKSWGKTTPISI